MTAIINDGDIHRDIYFGGAAFRGGEDGAGAFESEFRVIAGDEWHELFLDYFKISLARFRMGRS
jgi:hypothetical protein